MSNPITTPAKPVTPPVETKQPSQEDIAKIFTQMAELKKQIDDSAKAKKEVKALPEEVKEKPINWDEVSEKDVFDLSQNIPAVDQEAPQSEFIQLKDKSYIPRWVNVTPKRMGQAIQQGYTYITKEDLDPNWVHGLIQDTSGHYADFDVVAMKIHKARYYPRLRKNFEHNMSFMTKMKVQTKINNEVEKSNLSNQLKDSFHRGALSLYGEEVKEESIPDEIFEASLNQKDTPNKDLTL